MGSGGDKVETSAGKLKENGEDPRMQKSSSRIKAIPFPPPESHRIAFTSLHCPPNGLWFGVWPITDLILNDLLRWILPTYPATHALKFGIVFCVLLIPTVPLLAIVVFLLSSIISQYQKDPSSCMSMEMWEALTRYHAKAKVPLEQMLGDMFWVTLVHATVLFLCLAAVLAWWCWYNRRMLGVLWYRKDWMDPTRPAVHRLPMHVPLRLHTSVASARAAACRPELVTRPCSNGKRSRKPTDDDSPYATPNVLCLDSGTKGTETNKESDWSFCLFSTTEEALAKARTWCRTKVDPFPEDRTTTLPVPAHWTLHYDNDKIDDKPIYTNMKYPWPCQPPLVPHLNPTGVYRRSLVLPSDWQRDDDKNDDVYTLQLQGIESICYVYCNRQFIGMTKDSRLPAEFDVTRALKSVQPSGAETAHHELLLVVARWCDGSYTEDQDHWWMAGIHRSVELVRRRPCADIMNYNVQADANGQLAVQVTCRRRPLRPNKPPAPRRQVQVSLYQDVQTAPTGGCQTGPCLWTETVALDDDTQVVVLQERLDGIQAWTAETPHLYTLTVACGVITSANDNDDKVTTTQVEACRVGFRTVDLVNGQVQVNGKAITVCGMNRHEHDPDHGKVLSLARMHQDVCVLKQNNFNLVRTSHYPTHSSFYRLCDYYGLYVWDEANIEVHGMKPMGRLAHDPGWWPTFSSRITRTVERDRNHSCIIFWSMGNEIGRGRNLFKARQQVRELDPSRPVLYESGGALAEGTGRTELTDVICTMYPSVPRMIGLATRLDEDRPVILCEYSHAMGNSNGNLHLYWKAFWDERMPRLQGGAIWDFIDQGLRMHNEQGREYYAFGGDFDDPVNDLNFCINGMFSPEREPHPAVSEIKYLMQQVAVTRVHDSFSRNTFTNDQELAPIPVAVTTSGVASVALRVSNRYSFRDLSHLTWVWQLVCNRSSKPIRSGRFGLPNHKERVQDASIMLDSVVSRVRQLERTRPVNGGGNTYHLNIRGFLTEASTWAPAGHILVKEQFPVTFDFAEDIPHRHIAPPKEELDLIHLEATVDEMNLRVFRFRGKVSMIDPLVVIDKRSGSLVSFAPHGENVLASGLQPNFARAETDNDKGGMELALNFMFPDFMGVPTLYQWIKGTEEFSYASQWKVFGFSVVSKRVVVAQPLRVSPSQDGQQIDVVIPCRIVAAATRKELFKATITYSVFVDGRVCMDLDIERNPALRSMTSLPRVGVNFQLIQSLYNIRYYGRGPEENYPDRKSGAEMGVYTTTAADFGYDEYVVPGENGSRSDSEWIVFRSEGGEGLCVVSKEDCDSPAKFSCSALLYTAAELHLAKHTCDLEKRENGEHAIDVNIDHRIMGVGGDTSWYPVVYPEFQVDAKQDYQFQVWLLPLKKEDDAALVALESCGI